MRLLIIIFFLFLTSCFWLLDESFYVKNLTKDFNINMVDHPRTASLRINKDNEFGGKEIVSETITDVWYNDEFIVLKKSPNLLPQIKKALYLDTLYVDTTSGPYFQIKDKSFLKFLPSEANIEFKRNKYYHNSLVWNKPDSYILIKRKFYII